MYINMCDCDQSISNENITQQLQKTLNNPQYSEWDSGHIQDLTTTGIGLFALLTPFFASPILFYNYFIVFLHHFYIFLCV